MEKTLRVLNKMVRDGIIEQYAIGGAIGAIFYIEPLNTNDLDVFIQLPTQVIALDFLGPIYSYLRKLGYKAEHEAIEIEGWPVQFLPEFNPLIEEAVDQAIEIRFQSTRTRVMQAEHLMAIMLQTGRLKDFARLAQFVDTRKYDPDKLLVILKRHRLLRQWKKFENMR